MDKLTAKQKKMVLICIGVIVGSYGVRWLVTSARELAARQQISRMAEQRAKAQALAPRVPTAPIPVAPPRPVLPWLTTLSNLSGFWKGQSVVVNQGLCTLNLELRETDAPANYIGYSTLSCATPPSLWGLKGGQQLPPAMREQMLPTAIVMTGTPVNGAIRFQVNRTVVSPASGCETTSYTVTPFGTNRVAVQWLDGLCLGGQILMNRIGR